jgi:hypothetical protein
MRSSSIASYKWSFLNTQRESNSGMGLSVLGDGAACRGYLVYGAPGDVSFFTEAPLFSVLGLLSEEDYDTMYAEPLIADIALLW